MSAISVYILFIFHLHRNQPYAKMGMVTKEDVHKLLQEHSTQRHFIEYGGYLSNHMAHGIIALYHLGQPVSRMNRFVDWYAERLEAKEKHPDSKPHVSDDELPNLLGKNEQYYSLVAHYEKALNETYDGSLSKLIQKEFPKLSKGIMSSALHGLIQTGYGFSVDHARIVAEGLAYIHYDYFPIKMPQEVFDVLLGNGEHDVLDVLKEMQQDAELVNTVNECNIPGRYPEVGTDMSSFGLKSRVLAQLRGEQIGTYCNKIKIPAEVLKADNQAEAIGQWFIKTAIFVYGSAEVKNDFFLLHGVTAAWSLSQLLPSLEKENIECAAKTFACCLLITYAAQGFSKILSNDELQEETALASVIDFKELIARATCIDHDEHVIKLVQVCNDICDENASEQFTAVCKRAANRALTEAFVF